MKKAYLEIMENVVIVPAQCYKTRKKFGIRYERINENVWMATWAFPLIEASAKKEKLSVNSINGSFTFGSEYPGCPYCNSLCLFKCGCGIISCWDGETNPITCPSCNHTGNLEGDVTNIDTISDR